MTLHSLDVVEHMEALEQQNWNDVNDCCQVVC